MLLRILGGAGFIYLSLVKKQKSFVKTPYGCESRFEIHAGLMSGMFDAYVTF